MTTDDLRAWMKALEERDVRIVALEKDVRALTQSLSEAARQLQELQAKAEPNVQNLLWSLDDAHAQAAAEMFDVPLQQVTKQQRAQAKALTFPERCLAPRSLSVNPACGRTFEIKPKTSPYYHGAPLEIATHRDALVSNVALALADGLRPDEEKSYVIYALANLQKDPEAFCAEQRQRPRPTNQFWYAACCVVDDANVPAAYCPKGLLAR